MSRRGVFEAIRDWWCFPNESPQERRWRKQRETLRVKPIEIAGIYTIWYKMGRPGLGYFIQSRMESGKIAVYQCTDIRRSYSDWSWYIFTFHHYLEEGESYPVYC